MALSPPTVASDPASAAHFTTALGVINSYLTTAYSELSDAVNVLRDRVRLTDGNARRLDEIDVQIDILAAGPGSNPTVSTDPTAQGQANTALATLCTRVDTLNSISVTVLSIMDDHSRISGKNSDSFDRFGDAVRALGNPSSVTAITVGSDPVSQAHANAAFASVTAYVDSINSEISAALTEYLDDFRRYPANEVLLNRLENAIAAFA